MPSAYHISQVAKFFRSVFCSRRWVWSLFIDLCSWKFIRILMFCIRTKRQGPVNQLGLAPTAVHHHLPRSQPSIAGLDHHIMSPRSIRLLALHIYYTIHSTINWIDHCLFELQWENHQSGIYFVPRFELDSANASDRIHKYIHKLVGGNLKWWQPNAYVEVRRIHRLGAERRLFQTEFELIMRPMIKGQAKGIRLQKVCSCTPNLSK